LNTSYNRAQYKFPVPVQLMEVLKLFAISGWTPITTANSWLSNLGPSVYGDCHTCVMWSYGHASSDICWENTILLIVMVIQFNFENNTQIPSVKVCIHFFGGLCIIRFIRMKMSLKLYWRSRVKFFARLSSSQKCAEGGEMRSVHS
jgi:hypothetical protein